MCYRHRIIQRQRVLLMVDVSAMTTTMWTRSRSVKLSSNLIHLLLLPVNTASECVHTFVLLLQLFVNSFVEFLIIVRLVHVV